MKSLSELSFGDVYTGRDLYYKQVGDEGMHKEGYYLCRVVGKFAPKVEEEEQAGSSKAGSSSKGK